jgi:hypothetical protein
MSESVAYAEVSFTGSIPSEGVPAKEIAALLAEVRAAGGIP